MPARSPYRPSWLTVIVPPWPAAPGTVAVFRTSVCFPFRLKDWNPSWVPDALQNHTPWLEQINTWRDQFPPKMYPADTAELYQPQVIQALNGATNDQRPNQVLASPYAATRNIQSWINPAAFVQPALGTYGTMGARNVRGPGSINIDMGVTRTFRVREKQSIQFRAEAFDMPNHVNPNNPNVTFTDPNFGKILSAADGRTMQMALKYVF